MAKLPTFDFTFHHSLSPFTVSQQEYLKQHEHEGAEGYRYIATGALVFDKGAPAAAAAAAAAAASGPLRILLVQRSPGDSMPNLWEVPGGACDDDDPSILHAVARELAEESGLRAVRIERLVEPAQRFTSPSGKRIVRFNFIVRARTGDRVTLDAREHQRSVWASAAEVRCRKAGAIDLAFTTGELEDAILRAFEQQYADERS